MERGLVVAAGPHDAFDPHEALDATKAAVLAGFPQVTEDATRPIDAVTGIIRIADETEQTGSCRVRPLSGSCNKA